MNYFTLTFAIADLGHVPQNNGIIGNYSFTAPNSVYNGKWGCPVGDLWVPEGLNLRPKSKFTDMLFITEISFPLLVISPVFLDLLKKLVIPPILEVFPVQAIKAGKAVPYFVVISNPTYAEYYDFDTTEFIIEDTVKQETTPLTVKNVAEYLRIKAATIPPVFFGTRKIRLDTSKIEFDFFRLPVGGGVPFYIVSDRFVESVKSAGLTGIEFEPIEKNAYFR
jgi:hypothetical protein